MAEFRITCVRPEGGREVLHYDNMTSELRWEKTGQPVLEPVARNYGAVKAIAPNAPGEKRDLSTLKISLGLSCNYACGYCSQRHVPHASEAGLEDIEPFLDALPSWFDIRQPSPRIEFWGGEPLVYWKTLKPLAAGLRGLMPKASFLLITNGSLLDEAKNRWLDGMGFFVGISHDGPGQSARGSDPLDDPAQSAAIMDLYRRLHPQKRISFNPMLHRKNQSRADIQAWFRARFGEDVVLGEGFFIDPYDRGGAANSLRPRDHMPFRSRAFRDLREANATSFPVVVDKVTRFIEGLESRRPAASLSQKCGMDQPDRIAVTLKGEVMTCQNVSPVSKAPNGRRHRIGSVDALDKVRLDTATHWSHRKECPSCPMLHLCQGSCMFLQGKLWEIACDNAYSDAVPLFATAIQYLTGMIPVHIEHVAGDLREDRRWLWGKPG